MRSRADSTQWMWTRAVERLDEAGRLHRRFFHLTGASRTAPTWEPPADVFDDGREVVIVVAMPGVAADSLQVDAGSGVIVVRGTRPLPRTRTGHRVLQLEIPHGAFERRIALPPGRFDLARPELAEGCLVLRLTRHTTP